MSTIAATTRRPRGTAGQELGVGRDGEPGPRLLHLGDDGEPARAEPRPQAGEHGEHRGLVAAVVAVLVHDEHVRDAGASPRRPIGPGERRRTRRPHRCAGTGAAPPGTVPRARRAPPRPRPTRVGGTGRCPGCRPSSDADGPRRTAGGRGGCRGQAAGPRARPGARSSTWPAPVPYDSMATTSYPPRPSRPVRSARAYRRWWPTSSSDAPYRSGWAGTLRSERATGPDPRPQRLQQRDVVLHVLEHLERAREVDGESGGVVERGHDAGRRASPPIRVAAVARAVASGSTPVYAAVRAAIQAPIAPSPHPSSSTDSRGDGVHRPADRVEAQPGHHGERRQPTRRSAWVHHRGRQLVVALPGTPGRRST